MLFVPFVLFVTFVPFAPRPLHLANRMAHTVTEMVPAA